MSTLLRRGAVGAAVLAVVATTAATTSGDSDDNVITATMADAGQLEEGAEVRSSGVRVGEVSSIDLADGKARVTLKVAEGVLPLHEDATLTMRPVNVLGENLIDLDPGSDKAPFSKSREIPAERTRAAVTLQDVLNTFEDPTSANLAALVTTLGEGLDDNGADLARAIRLLAPAMRDTARVGNILDDQNEVLGSLVAATDPVVAALAADGGKRLDSLVGSTRDTLVALANQQKALEATLQELPGTLDSAQQTLSRLSGVARAGTPTLRALRPLTGDLEDVVGELRNFADSADPALASLKPVLAEADKLLDNAAPVVAKLRQAGPDLATTASSTRSVSRELLEGENLQNVMEFVRKWALSTNGRDGLSHYFRGVVYVTPDTLLELANSLIPTGTTIPSGTPPEGGKTSPTTVIPQVTETVEQLLGGITGTNGLLGGLNLLGSQKPIGSREPASDPTSALGLTAEQEDNLLTQLLGGNQ